MTRSIDWRADWTHKPGMGIGFLYCTHCETGIAAANQRLLTNALKHHRKLCP
jgi:hypothetical protein